jgi:hypothetical protein
MGSLKDITTGIKLYTDQWRPGAGLRISTRMLVVRNQTASGRKGGAGVGRRRKNASGVSATLTGNVEIIAVVVTDHGKGRGNPPPIEPGWKPPRKVAAQARHPNLLAPRGTTVHIGKAVVVMGGGQKVVQTLPCFPKTLHNVDGPCLDRRPVDLYHSTQ